MWVLFEVGIFFSRAFLKRKDEFAAAAEARHQDNDISADVARDKQQQAQSEVQLKEATDLDDEALDDAVLSDELEELDKPRSLDDGMTRDEDKPGP